MARVGEIIEFNELSHDVPLFLVKLHEQAEVEAALLVEGLRLRLNTREKQAERLNALCRQVWDEVFIHVDDCVTGLTLLRSQSEFR